MQTIQEHLDDLDRMIDGGHAPKHEIRSQIAFIAREVAVIQADNARLVERQSEQDEALAKEKDANAKLRSKKRKTPNLNPDRRF